MKLNEINQLLRLVDRELWIVTAAADGQMGGLLATFVSPISIVPEQPRLAVAISKQHHTWTLIEAAKCFAVHLVSADQRALAWNFGAQSGQTVDKFEGIDWEPGTTGSPLIKSAAGWLECRVEAQFDTGDRTIYLSEVVAGDLNRTFTPLTQQRFLQESTPDQLAVLKSQMAADAQIDAAATIAWRQQQNSAQ
jgi:flavin reductase (DIM6/NTAB) family NADH-FMN oxidoreductase RutF